MEFCRHPELEATLAGKRKEKKGYAFTDVLGKAKTTFRLLYFLKPNPLIPLPLRSLFIQHIFYGIVNQTCRQAGLADLHLKFTYSFLDFFQLFLYPNCF